MSTEPKTMAGTAKRRKASRAAARRFTQGLYREQCNCASCKAGRPAIKPWTMEERKARAQRENEARRAAKESR